MKYSSLKAEEAKVRSWNDKYPVGQLVDVERDNGDKVRTRTRNEATMMCGSAMGWFEGISGCYMLDRATAIEPYKETP